MEKSSRDNGTTALSDVSAALDSVVNISERWLAFLRRRLDRVRIISSVLTGLITWSIIAGATVGLLIITYTPYYIIHNQALLLILFGIYAVAGAFSGMACYIIISRKRTPDLDELAILIAEMKDSNGGVKLTANALAAAEKIIEILPRTIRKRNQDAILFGVAAFILSVIVVHLLPLDIIVGVGVWFYFKHELDKSYAKGVSRLEGEKKLFEKKKKEFMDSL